MAADTPTSQHQVQPDATPQLAVNAPTVSAVGECGETCGCRQRLSAALADAPPRRHELEVLRLYLDKQKSQLA